MKPITLASVAVVAAIAFASVPSHAQNQSTVQISQVNLTDTVEYAIDLNRAKNLARQAAERVNGGLGQYRAEDAMHGPGPESPYVDNGNGTWTFDFRGGPPGTGIYTVETVVTVNRSTWAVSVDYNGAIRN